MQSFLVYDVFDAVAVLFAARGIKIASNQETKLRFESLNASRWSIARWRKFTNCTDWLSVDIEEEDISEAQRAELALRIASSYLRCKVNLASYSSVSSIASNRNDRSFGYERSTFTTPTVTLNLGASNSVTFLPPTTSFEVNEEMVVEWLRPGARKSDTNNDASNSKSLWRESRSWAARLMLAGREALASVTHHQPEPVGREATDQSLQQPAEGTQTQQGTHQPVVRVAESNQAQQFADLFSQILTKTSTAGTSTSTILNHPAPILEKLSWDSVKPLISN